MYSTERVPFAEEGFRYANKPAGTQINVPGNWAFEVTRDGNDYGLSDAQCSVAFPKLYGDIDKMVARFKDHKITEYQLDSQDLEGPKYRIMIYDGELYLLSEGGLIGDPPHRGLATLHAINRALNAIPPNDRARLPNIEFIGFLQDHTTMYGHDQDPSPVSWAYTKRDDPLYDNVWLMPDFGFYDWPEAMIGSWNQARRSIQHVESSITSFGDKIPKVFWRGSTFFNPRLRDSFVETTANQTWADVATFNQFDPATIKKDMQPISDYCRYQFVAHMSGGSWSGSGKYAHLCHSVFISHKIEWAEIYHGALENEGPGQNWIQAQDGWVDLENLIQNLLAHPEKAKTIADNSVRTLRDRYLTPAAEACYWRRLIKGYGSVSFEPKFYNADGEWRGVPFESVALTRKLKWEAYEWRDGKENC